MIYLELFLQFFKVSAFTFGGGYSAVPLIREVVLNANWMGEEQLAHMIAVSESTPGPILVNLATYIGNAQAGFWGSVVATIAVILPAYLAILLVTGILKKFITSPKVKVVLQGFTPCIIGVILATGGYMIVSNCAASSDWKTIALTALLAAVMILYPKLTKKNLSPIAIIMISAVLGMVVYST